MSEQYYENQDVIIDVQDEDVDVVDSTGETTGSNKGLLGLAIGIGAGLAVAGVAAWKNRDKIKAKRQEKKLDKQIRELEKYGYCVNKPAAIEIIPDEVAADEEEAIEE